MLVSSIRILILTLLLTGNSAVAVTLGDDGLHKQDWFSLTFRDVAEDMADAESEGKRLAIVFEQTGCTYCTKMHETVLSDPEVIKYVSEHFKVVQYNLYGDEEVIDLDGEVLTEKTAAEKWGIMFTPTWLFLPVDADDSTDVGNAAVGTMPGAFGKGTFLDLFTWVYDKGYEGDESFQRYHGRRSRERLDSGEGDGS